MCLIKNLLFRDLLKKPDFKTVGMSNTSAMQDYEQADRQADRQAGRQAGSTRAFVYVVLASVSVWISKVSYV